MMKIAIAAAALALGTLPGLASAQAVEEKNLLSGKASIDAESGYLFVRGPVRQMGMILRLPDAETIADYEKDWAEAFAKVKAKYPSKLAGWYHRAGTARKEGREYRYEKPVEPTEENFSIGPIEFRGAVSFGPQFVFAKGKDVEEYSYLMELKPGRYAYYGPVWMAANGASAGACYCMGTVAFDVKRGVITDAGNFFLVGSGLDPDFPSASGPTSGSELGLYRPTGLSGQYGPLAFGLPEILKKYPNEQADFRAYGKLDNVYGITIARMPPVPGVLAYDRDRIVDLKAEPAAVNAPAAADLPQVPESAAPATTPTP
ncbi:hypothetical protein [Sphingopyxis sp.]|uniref:hypothetical protein n=1 Tax=Sphingopyxis sp. TaxID=1908224 RepID=UPI003D0E9B0D